MSLTDTPIEASAGCPVCGEAVVPGDAFCESCGTELTPSAAAEGAGTAARDESFPIPKTMKSQAPGVGDECLECGGEVLDDGFCSQC
ncbi:MAG: zinc ribbon domain-containing protein, partial [Ilumatobacteraceae bacterium]